MDREIPIESVWDPVPVKEQVREREARLRDEMQAIVDEQLRPMRERNEAAANQQVGAERQEMQAVVDEQLRPMRERAALPHPLSYLPPQWGGTNEGFGMRLH